MLKPCPFCGNSETVIEHLGDEERPFFVVHCDQCQADGPVMLTEEGAMEAWNMRRKSDGDGT